MKGVGKGVGGGPKVKTVHEKEQVLAEVSRWASRGFPQRKIAEKLLETIGLQVTQPMIGEYLKEIDGRYKKAALEDRRVLVMRKLDELREVRNEAWAAWEKSWKNAKKSISESGETAQGSFSKDREEVLERLPGGEYLRIVLDCIKAERELLGLDEAMKVDVDVKHTAIPWDQLIGHRNEVDLIEAEIVKVEQLAITKGGSNGEIV